MVYPPLHNDVPGWMSEAELAEIDRLASHVPHGRAVLEIGSFFGRSAYQWANRLPSSRIVCVDPWDGTLEGFPEGAVAQMDGHKYIVPHDRIYPHFLANLRECRNVFPVTMKGEEFNWVFSGEPEPPALIFIDGDHSEVGLYADLLGSLPGYRYGADIDTVICGHDYGHPYIPHIKPIVDEYAARVGLEVYCPPGTSVFSLQPMRQV